MHDVFTVCFHPAESLKALRHTRQKLKSSVSEPLVLLQIIPKRCFIVQAGSTCMNAYVKTWVLVLNNGDPPEGLRKSLITVKRSGVSSGGSAGDMKFDFFPLLGKHMPGRAAEAKGNLSAT
ncbi:hypothetical protein CHARACLAT_025054 [Characodon lateralis]|uniref:Uncharacterized protein n=1 Tax=Characodon lateralis TaxID=208331 RepID=A0ABU7ECP7_9TELE|nr:hypothetical protein [Characodon lateralis]